MSADVAADIAKYTNKVIIFLPTLKMKNGQLELLLCFGIASDSNGTNVTLSKLQIMDTIKGTMTEIYNDLSKSTSGNTIAEVIQNFRLPVA